MHLLTTSVILEMREDLRSQNLSFTEIAKLVGENWQNLPPPEKDAFESQANADKEKYHRDLMEYKKTPDYGKYMQYLQEFKEKQAKRTQGLLPARHGIAMTFNPDGSEAERMLTHGCRC